MRFLGTVEAKVDAKGRVFLPASFRKVLGETNVSSFVLRKDIFQPCLVLYPEPVWNQMLDSLRSSLSRWNRHDQMVFRQFVANVEPIVLDTNGRFLIPRRHQQMAAIEGGVRFVGMDDYIEIWSDNDALTPVMDDDQFAQEIETRMARALGGEDGDFGKQTHISQ